MGYHVRAAMADTIGTAWAVCRYGKIKAIIKSGEQTEALMTLPPAALRLETDTVERLQKLGLYQISKFHEYATFCTSSSFRRANVGKT